MSRRIDPEPPSVWPKNLAPPPKSRYEKLKIRHELLVPDVLPEKALASSRLSNPDILYEIDRPAHSLYVQNTVSSASRSSQTLVGDTPNDMVGSSTGIPPKTPSGLRYHEDGRWSNNIIDQLVEAAFHHTDMRPIELSSTITETPPPTSPPHTLSPQTPPSLTPPPQTPPPLTPPPPTPPCFPRHTLPPHTLPPHGLHYHTLPLHFLPPHILAHGTPPAQKLLPHMPESNRRENLIETRSKRPYLRSSSPPYVHESLADEQNALTTRSKRPRLRSSPPPYARESLADDQDDGRQSSDHYTSSDVSECWEEKRARHFRETMFPDRTKKHKVGTSAYYQSFNDFPSTPPDILAKRDPRYFMSGALQSEQRTLSRDSTPIARQGVKSIGVPTRVEAAPHCICSTIIPGAERYDGHYHAINGISTRQGKWYFDCIKLCAENQGATVNVEFPILQKQCPKLTNKFLSGFGV